MKLIKIFFIGFLVIQSPILAACDAIQRPFLFFPSHDPDDHGLSPWKADDGNVIGFSRQVTPPENVWLMLQGNAGQAADRAYAIPSFSPRDSVFIMEYPGYGGRRGSPSRSSIDDDAAQAYTLLRDRFPSRPVCVVGESLGTGPACTLARQPHPPDKIVLITPFDTLRSVALEHVPILPYLFMWNGWNNIDALARYPGPVDVYGAAGDTIIPIGHARRLAGSSPMFRFHEIACGHNEWADDDRVRIRNP